MSDLIFDQPNYKDYVYVSPSNPASHYYQQLNLETQIDHTVSNSTSNTNNGLIAEQIKPKNNKHFNQNFSFPKLIKNRKFLAICALAILAILILIVAIILIVYFTGKFYFLLKILIRFLC